jgi:hypothetical protein
MGKGVYLLHVIDLSRIIFSVLVIGEWHFFSPKENS